MAAQSATASVANEVAERAHGVAVGIKGGQVLLLASLHLVDSSRSQKQRVMCTKEARLIQNGYEVAKGCRTAMQSGTFAQENAVRAAMHSGTFAQDGVP